MINLGKKMENPEMYPTMVGEDKVNRKPKIMYPSVCLPLTVMGNKTAEVGQEIEITLKGTVKAIMQTEYCEDITIEITEGEVEGSRESKEEGETLLGASS